MSNILNILDKLPTSSAIVIRHAERYDICKPDDYWECGLTDTGIKQAIDFGMAIAEHFDSYRLFFSPVKRCQQTAENIMASLVASGKEVISINSELLLGVSYIQIDIIDGFAEADKFGNNFIRAWFDGEVDSSIFMPLHDTKKQHLAYFREKFSTSSGVRHLDIHVTHDWNINVLREGIFGLKHEDAGWPDFLTGLGFSGEPFSALLSDENTIHKKLLNHD